MRPGMRTLASCFSWLRGIVRGSCPLYRPIVAIFPRFPKVNLRGRGVPARRSRRPPLPRILPPRPSRTLSKATGGTLRRSEGMDGDQACIGPFRSNRVSRSLRLGEVLRLRLDSTGANPGSSPMPCLTIAKSPLPYSEGSLPSAMMPDRSEYRASITAIRSSQ